jgi:hypothetical protein
MDNQQQPVKCVSNLTLCAVLTTPRYWSRALDKGQSRLIAMLSTPAVESLPIPSHGWMGKPDEPDRHIVVARPIPADDCVKDAASIEHDRGVWLDVSGLRTSRDRWEQPHMAAEYEDQAQKDSCSWYAEDK